MHTKINFRGSQNLLEIGERVYVVHRAMFLLHGYRSEIHVGEGTSIQKAVLTAGEFGMRITIGRDCMIAHGVLIGTTDYHTVIERSTGRRVNPAASIYVGNHVWLCDNVRLAKGAAVGDGCVVGVRSPRARADWGWSRKAWRHGRRDVKAGTRAAAQNAEIVGAPARVVKHDVKWIRGRIIDGSPEEIGADAFAESCFTRGCERIERGVELLEMADREYVGPAQKREPVAAGRTVPVDRV